MTKRDFDRANKINYGAFMGARYEYRAQLGRVNARDRLAERAAWRKRNPQLAVLEIASQYRAPVEWRLLGRLPRLADER
jgi:hypothetical protein